MKTNRFRQTYMEDKKNKDWMNKNLAPSKQSGFIRAAVAEKIIKVKEQKNG